MKMLKSVYVMGKNYKIIPTTHITELGLTEFAKCEITIATEADPQQVKDSVLHEIIHAIDLELKLDMEERQVHCMATALLALFKDNPELVEFLDF
jgi:hypothetical protein